MSQPLLVLGLDGLDIQKTKEWAPELLLDYHNEIDLEEFDHISTYHIWPTMYMGKTPVEHSRENRSPIDIIISNWNSIISSGCVYTSPFIPQQIRDQVNTSLSISQSEVAPQQGGREQFSGETIFGDLYARIIDLPGWNFRDTMDIRFTNESLWDVVLREDGVEESYNILCEELEVKVEKTERALNYPYDIIWTHIHTLDSIQHLFDREVQREWYKKVSDTVQPLIEHKNPRGVIILSDHGLEGGDHREPGIVATNKADYQRLPDRPRDVRPWLESIVYGDSEANRKRMKHLSDLGYKEVPDL